MGRTCAGNLRKSSDGSNWAHCTSYTLGIQPLSTARRCQTICHKRWKKHSRSQLWLHSLCQLEDIHVPLNEWSKWTSRTLTIRFIFKVTCMWFWSHIPYGCVHIKCTHIILYMTHLWYWTQQLTYCSGTIHNPKMLLGWILFAFVQGYVLSQRSEPSVVEIYPRKQTAYNNQNLISNSTARSAKVHQYPTEPGILSPYKLLGNIWAVENIKNLRSSPDINNVFKK